MRRAICAALLERFADCAAELDLTRRCAAELDAVLRGQADPLALLFPGGSLADTERLYRDSPPAKTYNGLIAEIFGTIGGATAGRRLRVLEIGAGTGSTTSHLLSRLPEHVEYTFTDVSPLFLQRAREKFAQRPFMRYELLDISREPAAQGFAAASFDVILAANVLHATPDLEVTLGHVHELLAPGGLLVLLEGTTPQRFGDLTVGLLEGWWAYTDTKRRDYALMARPQWLTLLEQNGFEGVVAIPGDTRSSGVEAAGDFRRAADRSSRSAAIQAMAARARRRRLRRRAGHRGACGAAISVEMLPADGESLAHALRHALGGAQRWDGLLFLPALGLRIDDSTTTLALWQGQEQMVRATLQVLHGLAAEAGSAIPAIVAGHTRSPGGAAAGSGEPGSGDAVGPEPCDRARASGTALPAR